MSAELIESWMEAAGATRIKPSGDNLIACCPFHDDHKRSFSMNTETGQFVCFAESCGEYGGLFAFLIRGCGFSVARAKSLAEDFGQNFAKWGDGDWSNLPDWENRRKVAPEEKTTMPERFLGLYDFCPEYMIGRGFEKKLLREWEIGYDFEMKRVTIPVRDVDGTLIGISKRATKASQETKYLHLGFKKSQHLYGAHFIPKDAKAVWTGEGQFDAIALKQLGLPTGHYPVSTMGARVSKKQINLLSKYPKVILAYDNDRDGISATQRIGEGLLEKGKCALVARKYGRRAKDPAELLLARDKIIERFIENLEPYDEVRLDLGFDHVA